MRYCFACSSGWRNRDRIQVRLEEEYLTRTHRDEYLDYRRDVRRWDMNDSNNQAILTVVLPAKYSSHGMLKRALSLAILIALVGGAVGASAADGSWVEGNMPVCCKKARSVANASEVSMARLCCKLNCSEPGSGGSSNASSLSRNRGTNSATAIIPTPAQFSGFAIRDHYPQANHSHNSNPKYIQHLALLI